MPSRRSKIVLGVASVVLVQVLAIAIYVVVDRGRSTSRTIPFAAEILTPRAAPPLGYEPLGGGKRSLAQLRGKVVMVHFWATWCEPCRRELPGLLALAGSLEPEGVFELIAVSVDDDWDEMRAFFGGAIPRSAVRPEGESVHRRFGASTLPDTYLVSATGDLIVRYAGARDWTTDAARRHLNAMIEQYGPTR